VTPGIGVACANDDVDEAAKPPNTAALPALCDDAALNWYTKGGKPDAVRYGPKDRFVVARGVLVEQHGNISGVNSATFAPGSHDWYELRRDVRNIGNDAR